nr:MAG TPA: coiled-coil domain-containing protein [Crassvirales sp.]
MVIDLIFLIKQTIHNLEKQNNKSFLIVNSLFLFVRFLYYLI